jgi:mRNA-degrading endonuclease RelE of RelBE toxin-antitoxin system
MRTNEDRVPLPAPIRVEPAAIEDLQTSVDVDTCDPVEVCILAKYHADAAPRAAREIVECRPIEFRKRDRKIRSDQCRLRRTRTKQADSEAPKPCCAFRERCSRSPERGSYPKELVGLGIKEYRLTSFKPYRVIYRVADSKVVVYLLADGRRETQSVLARRLLGG